MGDRSGLNDLDVAILRVLASIGARPDRPHVKSARALEEVYAAEGIPPVYGYEVIGNLAAPWLVNLRVLDPHGNFGSPDFGAANARYTEVRLSKVGMMAAAAEQGDGPPVPIGMINGDHHLGGVRPPFNAERITDTLAALVRDCDMTDEAITRSVGAPEFPTGCLVEGDVAGLAAGEPTLLTLRARLAHEEIRTASGPRHAIVASCLPPRASASEVAWLLKERAEPPQWESAYPDLANRVQIPIADIRDESSGGPIDLNTRLVIVLQPDGVPAAIETMLRDVWGIKVEANTRLPSALADVLRQWVDRFPDDDLIDGLTRLRALL